MNQYHRYRLKKKARFVFVVVFVLTLLTGGGLFAYGMFDEFLYEMGWTEEAPEKPDAFKGRINVLVMGMDTRKGENMARADTIMLCSVDTEKNIMSILSIPRDTRVQIPGHGYEKINSATVFGGPALAMKTVSDLLDVKVTNYVMTDYEGFKDIIDSLGGVTIDIKERMYHHDPEDGGIYTIDLRPGVQRLDGDKALQYVRYRNYALGDIDRAGHQQKFLSALIKEVLQPLTVVRLPGLIVSTYKAVDTNLSLLTMKKLAVAASNMTNASLVTQTLPGTFLNLDGASYWEPDPNLTHQVMVALYEGRTVGKVILGETTVATTDGAADENDKNKGKLVPGQPEGDGDSGEQTTGVDGTTPKTGTSGKPATGSSVKTGTDKKQSGSGVSSGKTGTGTGQSSGAIVPPRPSQQEQQDKKDQPVVIIVPKTVTN